MIIDLNPKSFRIIPKEEEIVLPLSFRDGIEIGVDKPEEGATKTKTFYQNTAPTGGYKAGDIWIDTDDDNHAYRADENKNWVSIRDTAYTAKITTFIQASAPTALAVGDLWFDSDDKNKVYRWDGTSWVTARDTDIPQALTDAANAQSTADTKIITFIQTTAPTASETGDIWFDSDDNYKPYRWDGTAWVAAPYDVADWAKITGAAKPEDNADVTSNHASDIIHYGTTAPTSPTTGMLWGDTSGSPIILKRYNGTTWDEIGTVDSRWSGVVDDDGNKPENRATRRMIYYQTTAPTSDIREGDLWIDSDDNNKVYRYDGSAFVAVPYDVADWAKVTGTGKPEDNADVTANHQADVNIDNVADGTTYRKLLDTEKTKLTGIEDGAQKLANHEAGELQAARNFEVVVDAAGTGDYTDIQSALNDGKKRIYVRGGTYNLSADIILDNDVLIQGESKYNTIINLNGANQIKAVGDTPYSTGTIAVTNGSATITGSGTSWSANLAAGDYIVFNGNVYKIVSVDSDTQLTIDIVYEGQDESGISYNAGTFKSNIHLEDLTFTGQSGLTAETGVIYWQGVVKSGVENCILTNNDISYSAGVWLKYCYNNSFSLVNSNNNGEYGLWLEYSDNNSFIDINANNNQNNGININYANNNFLRGIAANSNEYGIQLSSAEGNIIEQASCKKNKLVGVYILGGGNNILENINATDNGEYGVAFLNASSGNIASGLQIANNSSYNLYLENSDNNVFSGINSINTPSTNPSIYLNSSNGNIISDARLYGRGITLYNSNHNSVSCSVEKSENQGIKISASSHNRINALLKNNCQDADNIWSEVDIRYDGTVFSQKNIISVKIYEDTTNRAKYGVSEKIPAAWVKDTSYSLNDLVIPTSGNGFVYICTVSGTSGDTEPSWPTTVGDTVTDGSVTWKCILGNDYNLVHGCIIEGPKTAPIYLYGGRSVSADNITI